MFQTNLTRAFDERAGSPRQMKSLVTLRAVVAGLWIAIVATNVWPLLLLNLGVPAASIIEVIFLALYVWWAGGVGPPALRHFVGKCYCPHNGLGGLVAAFFFALTIHAAMVLLSASYLPP